MFQSRKQEVEAKVATLIKKAEELFDTKLPPIELRFDVRGRVAGWAGSKWGSYFMRFNVDMMMNSSWDHLLNDTVPHELAHIVCFVNPRLGRNHDQGWKRVCRMLGGNGQRCHNEQVEYANGKTFYYTTSTGHVVTLSSQIHRKVQQGRSYMFRHGKGRVCKESPWSTKKDAVPTVIKVTPPAANPTFGRLATVIPKPVSPDGSKVVTGSTMSKADQVRAQIRASKAAGFGEEHVITWAQINLNMTRTLARAYVQNNWFGA